MGFQKSTLAIAALAATVVTLGAAGSGSRAEYVGGTLAEFENSGAGRLRVTGQHGFVFQTKRVEIEVPYQRVNLLEYGQQASRRYALAIVISPMLLLTKKRAHFLTIGFTDDDGKQQAMVFRVDKNSIRALLVSLEAKTGRRVEYQDAEARKAGGAGE
jgi:hypothetical protein